MTGWSTVVALSVSRSVNPGGFADIFISDNLSYQGLNECINLLAYNQTFGHTSSHNHDYNCIIKMRHIIVPNSCTTV